MHELAPSYWQCELLWGVASTLHGCLPIVAILAVTGRILRPQGYHGVLDHKVVLEALAQCQVGANVFTR